MSFRCGGSLFNLICQVSVFGLQLIRDRFDFGLFLDQLFKLVFQGLRLLLVLSELLIGTVVVFSDPNGVIQSRGALPFGIPRLKPITKSLVEFQTFSRKVEHDNRTLALA